MGGVEKGRRNHEDVVAEVEDGALAARQSLLQVGGRELGEIALGRGEDQVDPTHQFRRGQLRPVELDADEAREVAQVLGEDEAASLHDHRHRLGAEVR